MAEDLSLGVLGIDTGPAQAALDKLLAQTDTLGAAAKASGDMQTRALAEAAKAATAYSDRLAGATMEQRAARDAVASASEALRALTQQQKDLTAAQSKTNSTTAEYQRLQKLLEQNRIEIQKAKQAIDENRAAVIQERAAVEAVREARRQEVNQIREANAAAKDLAATTKQAAKEAASVQQSAGGGESSGGGLFGSLLGKIAPIAAGLFSINKGVEIVKKGLADYAETSGLQNTFKAIAGSASEGAREYLFVKQRANELGLELADTAKAYTGLYAASKESNFAIATTRDLFLGLTAAGATLGRSQAQVEQALTAVEQMISKGTVSSQELKLQLGNALPGAFGLAAQAAGLTTAQFTKQLETGKILANDFLPKFAAVLKEKYVGGTADAAAGVRANLGRLNTFFQESSAKVGAFVAPAIGALASLVSASKTSAQVAQESASKYFAQADAAKQLTATVTPLLSRYEELSGLTVRNTSQQQELDSIIQQLAKSVPGAVTEFDKYGKALGINGEAVKKFLADQQNLTRYLNRDALRVNRADLVALANEQTRLQEELNRTETDPASGLKLRRAEYKVGQGQAVPSLLSQAESDKITNDLTAQLTKVNDDIAANLENRERLRGFSPLLPTVPTPAQIQGLVEKQQKIIKDLQERQKTAALEFKGADGGDFLRGAGGLDEQLDKAQERLNQLLGKSSKKAASDKLAAYERERQTYKELALKAAEQQEADAKAASEKQLQLELSIIYASSRKLRAAKKAAGLGSVFSAEEQEEESTRLQAAYKADFDRLQNIAIQKQEMLIGLQEEGDEKQLAQLDLQFAKEATKYQNQYGVLLELERKHNREREALLREQATRRAQSTQRIESSQADATAEVFGAGTGVSQIEAARSARQQHLDADRKFANERLAIIKETTTSAADEERAALNAQLLRIRNHQKALNEEIASNKVTDTIFKKLFGEEDGDKVRQQFEQTATQVIGSINQILSAQLAAEQSKIQAHQQNIESLQSALSVELQLNRDGAASNIKGIQDSINAEREAKREAQREAKEIAKQQQRINDLQAVSAIGLAVANIIAGWSTVPLAGSVLGLVAAAAAVAGFITTKASAASAAQSQGFFTGGFTGGNDAREERGVVHGKEFVHTAAVTDKYRFALFEPLHKNRPQDIDWSHPSLARLLPADDSNIWASAAFAGLMPDLSLPGKLRAERAEAQRMQIEHSFAPLQSKFDAMQAELSSIKETNAQMAARWDSHLTADGHVLIDPITGSRHEIKGK